MLLKKLQKAEKALSQARTGDESGEERRSIGSRPSLNRDQMTNEMRDKLEKVDQRLQSIKRQVHGAKEECIQAVMESVSKQINEARNAFVNNELLEERIRDDKVAGWNNIVKECCQISHAGRKFILVQTVLKEPDQ